ncbi:MAG: hypothetical protein ACRDO9_07105, partial [Gaiellales bacterium]
LTLTDNAGPISSAEASVLIAAAAENQAFDPGRANYRHARQSGRAERGGVKMRPPPKPEE